MILTVTANAAIDKRYVVESFDVGEVNRVKTCAPTAGGKGLNVARVAMLTGADVTATGFLGGHAGKFIEEQVLEQGIKSEFVWCKGESRTCINIWDEAKKQQTEFLEPGFAVEEKDCEELIKKIQKLLSDSSVLTISGSVPKGADAKLYKRMIREAKKVGIPVLLDTSGALLKECIEECPTLLKPNIDEIRGLTGRRMESKEDLLKAAQELHKKGVEIVAISLGGEGSLVSCKEGVYEVKVPKIDAVNTVGCGDSMIAGFAVGIARGYHIEETLRLASAVSAANAMRMETGFIVKEDMEALFPKIQITRLK